MLDISDKNRSSVYLVSWTSCCLQLKIQPDSLESLKKKFHLFGRIKIMKNLSLNSGEKGLPRLTPLPAEPQSGTYFVKNLKMVRLLYNSPGLSTVEGKFGLLGESGKC